MSSSGSGSDESLIDIETDSDEDDVDWKAQLGEDTFLRLSAWLAENCARHVALHQNRATHCLTNTAMLLRSWEKVCTEVRTAFPELPESFTDVEYCAEYEEGLADMFERFVFQGCMAIGREDVREWVRQRSTDDALAMARAHHAIATADVNMTSCVVRLIEKSSVTPQRLLEIVERAASRRRGGRPSDMATMGFNMAAADDLIRHNVGN